jgi:four helix bundle protein
MSRNNKNLEDRTLAFSENILNLADRLPKNIVNKNSINQLIKSGTSIGANYREACEAESSKDFIHKIKISKKEAKESTYWLKLLLKSNKNFENEIICLGKEAVELIKIFSAISNKFK